VDNKDMEFVMSVKPDMQKVEDAFKTVAKLVDDTSATLKKEIEASLQNQRKELERIQVLMRPDMLERQVKLEKDLLDMRKQHAKLLEQERHRQEGPGLFQRLFQEPKKVLNEATKHFGDWWKDITSEFKKSGFGGLIDRGLRGLRGNDNTANSNKLLGSILGSVMNGGSALGSIFGMVGEALAGPEGAAIGGMVARVLPQILAAPARMLTATLGGVSHNLNSLNSQLGVTGTAFNVLSGGVQTFSNIVKMIPVIGELLGPLLDELAMMPRIAKELVSTLTAYSRYASPAVAKQLQIANEDVLSAFGGKFVPFVESMIEVSRAFNEVVSNLLPSGQELRETLGPLREDFRSLIQAGRELLREVGPVWREIIGTWFKQFVTHVRIVIGAVTGLVDVFTSLAEAIRKVRNPILDLLGFDRIEKQDELRYSMAARNVSIQGFEEYERQLQMEAYRQPAQGDMPTMVNSIDRNVAQIAALLTRLITLPLGSAIGEVAEATVRRGMESVGAGSVTRAAVFGAAGWAVPGSGILQYFGTSDRRGAE
jgi:hypothetical protein